MSDKEQKYTANQVDLAYLTGVFNVSGMDGLYNELKRLKEIEVKPHQLFNRAKPF